MQGSHPLALPTSGLLQGPGEFLQGGIVIHQRQSRQVAVVDFLADLPSAMKVGQASAQRSPLLGAVGLAFFASVDPKLLGVVKGHLGSQHAALRRVSLVVKFDRILVHLMLDPNALGAFREVADHFALEALGHASGWGNGPPQKAHHVTAAEAGQAVMDEAWIKSPQRGRVPKHQVGGPLALPRRPVVGEGIMLKHLGVPGVPLLHQLAQHLRPIHSPLGVEQLLSTGKVLHPGKAVVLPPVSQTFGIHLPSQPLPSVQADLQGERKPGLQAGVHETEPGMNEVVIEVEAFPLPSHQFQAFHFSIPAHGETPAGLHAAQYTDQPRSNTLARREGAGHVLFADLAGSQIQHLPPQLGGPSLRGRFQLLTHRLHMTAKILQQNAGRTQVAHHPFRVADRSQAAPNQHPVKSGQNSEQMTGEFRDKLFHGVLLPSYSRVFQQHNDTTYRERLTHLWLRPKAALG